MNISQVINITLKAVTFCFGLQITKHANSIWFVTDLADYLLCRGDIKARSIKVDCTPSGPQTLTQSPCDCELTCQGTDHTPEILPCCGPSRSIFAQGIRVHTYGVHSHYQTGWELRKWTHSVGQWVSGGGQSLALHLQTQHNWSFPVHIKLYGWYGTD